jgi:hypothetical protein
MRDEFDDPAGYLSYAPNGVVTAVLGSLNRPLFALDDPQDGTAAEYHSAARNMIAYAGRYTFDATSSTMTHSIEVSLFPNWQGREQPRRVSLAGDRLTILASPRTRIDGRRFHSELTWERVPDQD